MCVGCVIGSKCYLGSPLDVMVISFRINWEKPHQSKTHSFLPFFHKGLMFDPHFPKHCCLVWDACILTELWIKINSS